MEVSETAIRPASFPRNEKEIIPVHRVRAEQGCEPNVFLTFDSELVEVSREQLAQSHRRLLNTVMNLKKPFVLFNFVLGQRTDLEILGVPGPVNLHNVKHRSPDVSPQGRAFAHSPRTSCISSSAA